MASKAKNRVFQAVKLLSESGTTATLDAVYDLLTQEGEVPRSTVYYHLRNLVTEGQLTSTKRRTGGRGRPQMYYAPPKRPVNPIDVFLGL